MINTRKRGEEAFFMYIFFKKKSKNNKKAGWIFFCKAKAIKDKEKILYQRLALAFGKKKRMIKKRSIFLKKANSSV
jgi:hypothetical protein